MKHEVEVSIDESGEVSFEVHGIKGQGCLAILEQFTKALGEAGKVAHTAEMKETVKTTVKQHP